MSNESERAIRRKRIHVKVKLTGWKALSAESLADFGAPLYREKPRHA